MAIIDRGARNIQNFELLKAVGLQKKPVLLKRGLANTLEECVMSAEYIMACLLYTSRPHQHGRGPHRLPAADPHHQVHP